MKKFKCKVCGYIYEGESLPADFICPVCKKDASFFEEIAEPQLKGSKTEANLKTCLLYTSRCV